MVLKSDVASGLSRVDGPVKEMHRYQWGYTEQAQINVIEEWSFVLPILNAHIRVEHPVLCWSGSDRIAERNH
jgi:hypothetical protein